MALIPPFFLDCVEAIGRRSGPDSVNWMASSFLFGEHLEDLPDGQRRYQMYLVTNRHVLENEQAIVLRFSSEDASLAPAIDLSLVDALGQPKYLMHPDPSVDVAVLPIDVAILRLPGTKFSFFQSDQHVLDLAGARTAGVSEGDGMFVLGFPLGQVGGDRNYVIVRDATLARVRDALTGATKEFLIDASIYPGNSGGPVVTRPELVSITGTQATQKGSLVGIVTGYVPYQDVAVSRQTGHVRIVFTENSDLAAVVPIDYVREVIHLHLTAIGMRTPSVTTAQPSGEPEDAPQITSSDEADPAAGGAPEPDGADLDHAASQGERG